MLSFLFPTHWLSFGLIVGGMCREKEYEMIGSKFNSGCNKR